MANRLKVAKVSSIHELRSQGWSQRRIARELGVSRGAVSRHLRAESNRAKAPPGSRSLCAPYHDQIVEKLQLGLSAQRIFQDLTAEHGFPGKYCSVRRYVAGLGKATPLPFRRMEVEPGAEAQIDFGKGASVVEKDGRRRRTHVLRVVLSHSRKAYSEAVFRQTTEELIRCLENAFHHFGGVPKTLVPDNLKAAVLRADWYDPDVNPKLQSFCEHYGTVLLPTKPRTPRHKGKVERGVGYVQDNGLKGRVFSSLAEQNDHLRHWEATTADTRIHGTTRRQVATLFEERERSALQPLARERFPCFKEERRKVSRDAHVAVAKSYYSVPPEYLGHEVWVRWDLRLVRIYDRQMQLIATHAAKPEGAFSTHPEHLASEKINSVERGMDWLLNKTKFIGPKTHSWALGCVANRGVQAMRVLQGLLSLTRQHRSWQIESACQTAHANGCYRLKSLRRLIDRVESQQQHFEFLEEHPLIRNLATYGEVVGVNLQKEAWKP